MNASQLTPDTVDFLRLLEKHDVRYLLIGGHAVFYHGHTRLTADVDFAYDPEPSNAALLYRALAEFWNGHVPGIDSAEELAEVGMVFQFGRVPNRIDLLSRVKGIDFASAWERRIDEELVGPGLTVRVRIIGLTDLRAAKAAAGRPKDIDDLDNLPRP